MKHFFYFFLVAVIAAATLFFQGDPSQGLDAAMRQVNGGSQEATDFYLIQTFRSNLPLIGGIGVLLTTLALYGRSIKHNVAAFGRYIQNR